MEIRQHTIENMNIDTFEELNEVFKDLDKKVNKALMNNDEFVEISIKGQKYKANVYDSAFTLGWMYGVASWNKSDT